MDFRDNTNHPVYMSSIKPHFDADLVDSLIGPENANNKCPANETRTRYQNLGSVLLYGSKVAALSFPINVLVVPVDEPEKHPDAMDALLASRRVDIKMVFDRLHHLQVEGEAVPELARFNADLAVEVGAIRARGTTPELRVALDHCKQMRERVYRLWFAALIDFVTTHGRRQGQPVPAMNIDRRSGLLHPALEKKGLNFQRSMLNAAVFTLTQSMLAVPAYFYITKIAEVVAIAVMFAIADALASPHFLSGSGLTTARCGAEEAIWALAEHYHSRWMAQQGVWREITRGEAAGLVRHQQGLLERVKKQVGV